MNSVVLIGNAGGNAEVKSFENGKLANFSLATNERYMRGSEQVTKTDWHRVVAWGKLADQVEELVVKGKYIKVEGKLVNRNYTNKDNQKVYITEVQALKVSEAGNDEN
ncbi:single-stranded DNA-binding protein [Jiulongibacter sediminis]|jgi:single-strand DNA-binding protein|uniref:single-stranded DNA-binding protein n=1 Tax=Jiulongibacter sediminis TaxID=1605367 RepID=UPI0026EC8F19|nr:single-stranded DNA-binding protein [Jiulongibacter sediminis]